MIVRKSEFAKIVGRTNGAITQATQGRDGNPPTLPMCYEKFIDTNNRTVRSYMLECGVSYTDDEIADQFGFSDRTPSGAGRKKPTPAKSTKKAAPQMSELEKREDRMAKAKLKKAEGDAMKSDIQAKKMRGELVSRELFVDVAMSYLAELHARLLNEMPTAAATVIAGLEKDQNFINKVEREIHDNTSSILRSSKTKIEQLLATHPQNENFTDVAAE